MTKNQIEYNKLVETQRANRAQEMLTSERDLAARRLGLNTLQETQRHNEQVELNARDNLAEQYRNNVAQLAELQRTHLVNEGLLGQQNLLASERQRLSEEAQQEVIRHNLASEDISLGSIAASRLASELSAQSHVNAAGISAGASRYASDQALLARQLEVDAQKYGIDTSAGLRSAELKETNRANVMRELETKRSNIASERIRENTLLENVRNNIFNNFNSAIRASQDVALRSQANAIAQSGVDLQSKRLDLDISLAPSQQFGTLARGTRDVLMSAGQLTSMSGG